MPRGMAAPRRRRDGDPVLHADRAHGDGRWPASARHCRLVGLSPDPRTVNALTLSWGVEAVHVDEYRTSDEMVWFAVQTALQHGFVARERHRARAGRCPRPPQRRGGRRAAHRAGDPDAGGSAVDGHGGTDDGPLVVLVHGSMDRSAGLLKLSRRLDGTHSVARYDRRGYGRSTPHDGPFDIDGQVDDLEDVLAWSAGGAVRAQLRRPRRAGPGGPSARAGAPRSPCTRRRCRGSTGGRAARPAATRWPAGATPRRPPSASCAGSSATIAGLDCHRRRGPHGGPRDGRW